MSAPVVRRVDRRAPRFVFLTDDAVPGPTSRYAWRLDAANHRPLGRAATVSLGLEGCRAAAAAVHDAIGSAVEDVLVERSGAYWAWRVVLDTGSAVSLHRYLRRVECLRGFAQFAQVVGVTDPDLGVVRTFGQHTLRSYAIDLSASSEKPA